jgi:hypothetical protein
LIQSHLDLRQFGKQRSDIAFQLFAEWNKGWQAIAADTLDFTTRSFEDGAATLEKLYSAKSIEHALEIQSGFTRRACDAYLHQFIKTGGMFAELVREAWRPIASAPRGSPPK